MTKITADRRSPSLKATADQRKIAMTDLETSGDVFGVHEILEIGLVVFDPKTFEILDTYNQKVKPLHVENAVPAALIHNGYKLEDWKEAIALEKAIKIYGEKTEECLFCSYNVSFDWGFISDAFWRAKIENPMSTFENHDRLDLLTLAWAAGLKNEKSLSLKTACKLFGIDPEPEPHTALNGAMTAYKLFQKLFSK
jgi:DNA polymerase III epsilon subunit-like protein